MFQPPGGAVPGRLPAFPGVGTPPGHGFSCGSGVGLPPSTWGRPGHRGPAAVGGSGDPDSHSQPVSGSWRPGRASGLRNVRVSVVRAHVYPGARSPCARRSSERVLGLSSLASLHPGGGCCDHPHLQAGKLRLRRVKQPAAGPPDVRFSLECSMPRSERLGVWEHCGQCWEDLEDL